MAQHTNATSAGTWINLLLTSAQLSHKGMWTEEQGQPMQPRLP